MKRVFSFLLALLLCLLLWGCGVRTPTTLADTIDLPPDGVVSAETLTQLRDQRQVATLRGKTDGVAYTWTLFGTEISEPKDCNFALTRIRVDASSIELSFASAEDFGFAPLLTVFLPQAPDADAAVVYRADKDTLDHVCEAAVTVNDEGGAISFSVADPTGVYFVVPEKASAVTQPTVENGEAKTTAVSEITVTETTEPVTTAPTTQETSAADATTAAATTAAQTAAATTRAGTTSKKETTASEPEKVTTTAAPTTAQTTAAATEPQTLTCTFSVECRTVFQHLEDLAPGKLDVLPSDGVILPAQRVSFTEGESVFDLLQRLCRERGVPMEASYVPLYNSAYVEGISNLYEFDCGENSGWMYRVNGAYPNFGCSRYVLRDGDVVEFRYTCDLGADIGGKNNYS